MPRLYGKGGDRSILHSGSADCLTARPATALVLPCSSAIICSSAGPLAEAKTRRPASEEASIERRSPHGDQSVRKDLAQRKAHPVGPGDDSRDVARGELWLVGL